jgi:L-2-hydroxyglutarate oxidase LhgO
MINTSCAPMTDYLQNLNKAWIKSNNEDLKKFNDLEEQIKQLKVFKSLTNDEKKNEKIKIKLNLKKSSSTKIDKFFKILIDSFIIHFNFIESLNKENVKVQYNMILKSGHFHFTPVGEPPTPKLK